MKWAKLLLLLPLSEAIRDCFDSCYHVTRPQAAQHVDACTDMSPHVGAKQLQAALHVAHAAGC